MLWWCIVSKIMLRKIYSSAEIIRLRKVFDSMVIRSHIGAQSPPPPRIFRMFLYSWRNVCPPSPDKIPRLPACVPTKKGLCLGHLEYERMKQNITDIEQKLSELKDVIPCFHKNIEDLFTCSECCSNPGYNG